MKTFDNDENKDEIKKEYELEQQEWLDSLRAVVDREGGLQAEKILELLEALAHQLNIPVPLSTSTSYVNTIPQLDQSEYPGELDIETRNQNFIRWNAMAMVVHANKLSSGIGGHISTFASCATLYEVGFNHFFRGKRHSSGGDHIYFQGHASPGNYSRAFLEGRLNEEHLKNFRREIQGNGISSYPHPWLMSDFWEFPTVSMGLGPIQGIYRARFMRYLENRGLKKSNDAKVWVFVGDGETDEPESLCAIKLAAREKLDNLIFVVNCNLQRLDGPVRGNGKIIQELEQVFAGVGWNVIKVIWGSEWDSLFSKDKKGKLAQRLMGLLDGEFQKCHVKGGAYIREKIFGGDPDLLAMVEDLSDDYLGAMRVGGHDFEKVFAAYDRAIKNQGTPTVILAQTIKGYGLGEAGEGMNITHQQKSLTEEELRVFRDRLQIPISDQEINDIPFYRPAQSSPEIQYLLRRRHELGGFVPERKVFSLQVSEPAQNIFEEFFKASKRPLATTMILTSLLSRLLSDPKIGKLVVPIVPDEARTFGMDSLFKKVGIYSSIGQLYDPVDKANILYYREIKEGQLIEEGITEAGSMASFISAGTGYSTHQVNTIPFFFFYSMFGFQRIGDLIWASGDIRAHGFLIGCIAGRTTLAGEGLQHQDGQSHILALSLPNLKAYDPCFSYEIAVIVKEGLKRMHQNQEDLIYYLTVGNELYEHPDISAGVEEGILKGIYLLKKGETDLAEKDMTATNITPTDITVTNINPTDEIATDITVKDITAKVITVKDITAKDITAKDKAAKKIRVELFGSGAILKQVLKAQQILLENYNISSDVWSVTSYKEIRDQALEVERWNWLHPQAESRRPYLLEVISELVGSEDCIFIAASDYLKVLPDSIAKWLPGPLTSLGTDGFGRSGTREELSTFFEVSPEYIVWATLSALYKKDSQKSGIDNFILEQAKAFLNIQTERQNPAHL